MPSATHITGMHNRSNLKRGHAESFRVQLGTGEAGGSTSTALSPVQQVSPRQCQVRFGSVEMLHHSISLDDSKLPSDGLAPVGLGELQGREMRRLDSYEEERATARRGVGIIPPEHRREALGLRHRRDSLDRIEEANAQLRHAQMQSLREHLTEMRSTVDDSDVE